ncbi:MAG: SDR family NAD(P)-dependent oxidoreductase [Chlorobiaceae bacterium]|nr:SDR family NAD(P)-dependent oxidoreductase [Chlorobiaceae bacterium]
MSFYTLLTGASTGIGKALATDFARRGSNLILVARSREKLEALAGELTRSHGVDVRLFCQDLEQKEAASKVFGYCQEQGLAIDCLVNCAGFSVAGCFERMAEEDIVRMVMVNMVAVASLTHLFLPPMLVRRRGTVINIASLAGFQGVPGMAHYSGTKAYVVGLTEALSGELRDTGIRIFAVCPGFIDNDLFYSRAGHQKSRIVVPVSSVDVVVRAVRRGLRGRGILVLPTLFDRLMVFSQRFVPRKMVIGMAGFFAGAMEKRE